MKGREIYIDYGATTPVDPRVMKKALPYFSDKFGNPSSSHFAGKEAKNAIVKAREQVADFLNCTPYEVVFTSGGTESENLAIKGLAFSAKKFGNHAIVSSVEHLSVSTSADFLKRQGFEVSRVSVDSKCNVNIQELESLIKDETILISIMLANNEVGTIQPLAEISKIIKCKNKERAKTGKQPIRFHADGEAAAFYTDINVKKIGADAISINGAKLYSLKGASALFVKKGVSIATQTLGGGQERFLRGGTENVPAIVALGEAVSLAKKERNLNIKKTTFIKKDLIEKIIKEIPGVRLNTPENSLPNLIHFTFLNNGLKKDLVGELSNKGIAVSRGSACSAVKTFAPSATLAAMGFSNSEAYSSIRFSLGKYNKNEDVGVVVKALKSLLK